MSTEAGLNDKVRESIELLTELQRIDDELREIALERGDLPAEAERLEKKLREYEIFIEQRRSDLLQTDRELAENRIKLETARERLAKLQQQQYAVKTTREYDALTAELTFAKEEIAVAETAISAATQRRSELVRLIEGREAELEPLRTECSRKMNELREKIAETEEEERELLHRRENVVVRLMKPLYAHYERIRKAKDGRGVAHILDGACGGCFAVLPPQTQVNIRKLTDIVLCETCGRIIVP